MLLGATMMLYDGAPDFSGVDRAWDLSDKNEVTGLGISPTFGSLGETELAAALKQRVAMELGKALAPREVLFVSDLPKTRNAKLIPRLVRAVYLDESLGDTSSLEHPASLEALRAAHG